MGEDKVAKRRGPKPIENDHVPGTKARSTTIVFEGVRVSVVAGETTLDVAKLMAEDYTNRYAGDHSVSSIIRDALTEKAIREGYVEVVEEIARPEPMRLPKAYSPTISHRRPNARSVGRPGR